jgi:hypothetical protein
LPEIKPWFIGCKSVKYVSGLSPRGQSGRRLNLTTHINIV